MEQVRFFFLLLVFVTSLLNAEVHFHEFIVSCKGVKAQTEHISLPASTMSLSSSPAVFTIDVPPIPPITFDYTGNVSRGLWQPTHGTKAYKLKYMSKVQIILQDTSIVTTENHPMHLHGYEFYVVGTGIGNFNPNKDTASFNLIDPPRRNTIGTPPGGWISIRFVADSPGVWLMHCHIDSHLLCGLAMVFLVENGEGHLQSVQSPPLDLP